VQQRELSRSGQSDSRAANLDPVRVTETTAHSTRGPFHNANRRRGTPEGRQCAALAMTRATPALQ